MHTKACTDVLHTELQAPELSRQLVICTCHIFEGAATVKIMATLTPLPQPSFSFCCLQGGGAGAQGGAALVPLCNRS